MYSTNTGQTVSRVLAHASCIYSTNTGQTVRLMPTAHHIEIWKYTSYGIEQEYTSYRIEQGSGHIV